MYENFWTNIFPMKKKCDKILFISQMHYILQAGSKDYVQGHSEMVESYGWVVFVMT